MEITLSEQVSTTKARIDWEQGIIRGVKVLGKASRNRKLYTPEAMQSGLKVLEQAPVYFNHQDKVRTSEDRWGTLINCRVEQEEVYADCPFLTTHPMNARLKEAQDRGLNFFGLSINGSGKGRQDKQGTKIVEEITQIQSVDVVSGPGTTMNLLEQEALPTEQAPADAATDEAIGEQVKAIALDKSLDAAAKLEKIKMVLEHMEEMAGTAADAAPQEAPAREQAVYERVLAQLKEQYELTPKKQSKSQAPRSQAPMTLKEQTHSIPGSKEARQRWLLGLDN